jgi:hypothetical protein
MADIADALEPTLKAEAKERMIAAHASPGKFPELSPKGNALDHVARIVGKDRKTIEKARAATSPSVTTPAAISRSCPSGGRSVAASPVAAETSVSPQPAC